MSREPVSRYPRSFGICAVATVAAIFVASADAVTISTVPVGYPGNAPDPLVASGNTTGYGAVAYSYNIGQYDVTNAQYVEFLNAKAATADPYGLWSSQMDPSNSEGAISRTGSGLFTYAVKPGYANKPVVYVSWYDAVRFVNWLTNGQGNGDTESGTYLITSGGYNSGTVAVPSTAQRAIWAATNSIHWLLPCEDEWYKAAYFNGSDGTYYAYPFQSNLVPVAATPPGAANTGNFQGTSLNRYPAFNYDGNGSHLTDVGAYQQSTSPFGAFDMGGDVFQWDDALFTPANFGPFGGLRGGGWDGNPSNSASVGPRISGMGAQQEGDDTGFRVASVPEPASFVLALIGLIAAVISSHASRAQLSWFAGCIRAK